MPESFYQVLREVQDNSYTSRDVGTKFEKIIRNYFYTSKKYAGQVKKVWLWNDFPYKAQFGGQDTGIDVIIWTQIGDYWAVQCKCYDKNTVMDKNMVDSFLSTSSRTFVNDLGERIKFAARIWVSTSEKWGRNALEAMSNQDPPCIILRPDELAYDATVDWGKLNDDSYGTKAAMHVARTPRPHQIEAIAKAHEYYKTHDRGKIIMACGTGKTYTSLKLVEKETKNKGLVLILVPSIALVNQTLNEWNTYSEKILENICVCSDATASAQRQPQNTADNIADDLKNLAMPAVTNPVGVARQIALEHEKADGMVVVFSTYQSIDVISKAQQILKGTADIDSSALFPRDKINHLDKNYSYDFDYIVCDEAHRTTGSTALGEAESEFVKVHDNSFIQAKKRLYMTATPRLYAEAAKKKAKDNYITICSMDDPNLYGDEFYRIGFGEAVERGLLADYKVLILTVRDNVALPDSVLSAIADENQEINTSDAVKLVGVINALSKRVDPASNNVKEVDPGLMHKAVAFCSRIAASEAITKSFNQYAKSISNEFDAHLDDNTVHVTSRHIDGAMSAEERNGLISWLKNAPTDGNECRILTNVRCLSEGVDVPSLDAVIFLSARSSQVDVVQSVGRVMRNAPGKKYGYIIIPVVIPSNADANSVLDSNKDFKTIWTVLNALRAHDDRFNAWVNKLELNDKKPGEDGKDNGGVVLIGPGDEITGHSGDGNEETRYVQGLLFDNTVKEALYAKMVLKVGQRHYWEQWANDVAEIANRHQERIKKSIATDENYKVAFAMYLEGLHKNINPNIDQQQAIEMLSQHMVTKPVFDALFGNSSFTESNPISQAMKDLLDLVGEDAYDKDQKIMENFYKSVQKRCEGIDNASGKQKIIIELYDKFFKKALSKTVEKLGIVYTPVEIVDFINQSVADILKKEFNRNLFDENIHVIDPFTGTGTFIVRMIQSGLIKKEALARKYKKELHANEIVLLAYYIASVNIENAYHDAMAEKAGQYTPFDGICLTDTFQLYEDQNNDLERLKFADVFPSNSERVIAESKTPMQVIIGNPPYSVGQKSANDDAQNERYEKLEQRISSTYAAETKATNKNSLYDSYIKAFRWASDRLEASGGVIAFVTNAGWLDGNSMEGMRKCLEKEFSSIYVFNLRGNQRTSGETSRKEGGKIFGSGSRAPIAITVLVKKPSKDQEKATIYYREVDDYLTRENKLDEIKKIKSIGNSHFTQKVLKPNEAGDWLNQRSELFTEFTTIGDKKNKKLKEKVFNDVYSRGFETAKDFWIYNFSKKKELDNIKGMINFYNEERERFAKSKEKDINAFVLKDNRKISWSRSLLNYAKKNKLIAFDSSAMALAMYRPFGKFNAYTGPDVINVRGNIGLFFPAPQYENLLICTSGVGGNKDRTAFITDKITDLNFMDAGTQCFPLYWYEEKTPEANLFEEAQNDSPAYERHDGITDYIWNLAKEQYHTAAITKEDIFYYVYGLLHSEDYRNEFAADLKKMLPRIPLVEKAADFKAFMQAGRKLADLHLNYENQTPPADVEVANDSDDYTVVKMKFPKKQDKSVIQYNSHITIKNIPLEAYNYVVNGRSAIEWIIESYRIKTDKASGIVNDPNDWCKEHDDPQYILNLLLSVITVSIKTLAIVKNLPHIDFKNGN